jgi:imidazolonepropionase
MARHGTTTLETKTGCGPDEEAEKKILRVAAELQEGPLDIVTTFLLRGPDEPSNEVWRQMKSEFLPNIQRRNLIRFTDLAWDSLSEKFWKAQPDWRVWLDGFFQVTRSLGLGRKVHAESTSVTTAIGMALQHHAASIDHLEHANADHAALLADGDTVATLLPCSSFHRGGPYAPARALVEAGVPVAIATNFNPQHTPSLSMQTAIALACRCMGLTPAEAISAATINGAHALRCAGRIGSLECGKIADIVILDVSDYRELAGSLGTNLVHLVMKRGEVIYEQGAVAPRPTDELRPAW